MLVLWAGRGEVWTLLILYGLGGTLLKAVQSSDVNSKACVSVGHSMGVWFPVKVGLHQGCAMSP